MPAPSGDVDRLLLTPRCSRLADIRRGKTVKALEDDHDKPELYLLTEKELMEVASLLIYHGSVVKKPKRKKALRETLTLARRRPPSRGRGTAKI